MNRPVGISILAVLHFIGGIALGATIVIANVKYINDQETKRALSMIGSSSTVLIISMLLLCGLTVSSSIGMWKGKRWGWYLGSFYYVLSIIRYINVIVIVPIMMGHFPPMEIQELSRGPEYYYLKYAIRIVVSLLIYLYFFKSNVRKYFSIDRQKKWKPIIAELAICIGIILIVSILINHAEWI